jgi:hypothetical protein
MIPVEPRVAKVQRNPGANRRKGPHLNFVQEKKSDVKDQQDESNDSLRDTFLMLKTKDVSSQHVAKDAIKFLW